ncbi:MAG: HNH endonuclease [Eubacteriales bacterium]|nr:HNH endonuclease [Eubacteriales bacterium]MDD4512971.1 HNH endonuclease [Eubacteriales bacterium]
MQYRNKPCFIIKKNLQKSGTTGVYFSDVITQDVLLDVCRRITGLSDYDFLFVDNDYEDEFLERSYNKGRMAIMEYKDEVSYITFSDLEIGGRNSSVQSVPTAFNMFYSNPYAKKRLYYYFLNKSGNAETDYQILIYRLMNTIGFTFLNTSPTLSTQLGAFVSIEDIIFNRRVNAGRNQSNNSTFITKSGSNEIQIYGKTYGANKYETSLICYALANLWQQGQQITLYEMLEGNLKQLPASSLSVIESMGIIDVVPTDMTLEKNIFEKTNSLRSPRYLYNLFNKLGNKQCALCKCEIPELIQGAHIWPVADIKKTVQLTQEEKLACAIDGDNGLWLCENHHKMFDEHLLTFNQNGDVLFRSDIDRRHMRFIDETTRFKTLPELILTEKFLEYLWRRNKVS